MKNYVTPIEFTRTKQGSSDGDAQKFYAPAMVHKNFVLIYTKHTTVAIKLWSGACHQSHRTPTICKALIET